MIIYFQALLFILFASFIKCLVDNELSYSFFTRKSCCNSCKQQLKPLDLIPLFSYLFLKGRCRYCSHSIPLSIFIYELCALLIALTYIVTSKYTLSITYLDFWILLILAFISLEDLKTYEINSKLQIILLLLISYKLATHFNLFQFYTFFIYTSIFHFLYFISKQSIGYGDIKLFSILTLTTTMFESMYLFLYTFLYAGFYSIFLIITKKASFHTKVPLAPYIFLAYMTILINREFILW